MRKTSKKTYIDPKKFIELEEELAALKKEHGIYEKPKWWMKIGDAIANNMGKRQQIPVVRKKYLLLGLCFGWMGAHRFYSKQYVLGILYALFFWTGIPFAMALIDLMIALPMKADEDGLIII